MHYEWATPQDSEVAQIGKTDQFDFSIPDASRANTDVPTG